MKFAICMTGHMRSFLYCFKSVRAKLCLPNKADLFISTWADSQCGVEVTSELLDKYYNPWLKKCRIEDDTVEENFVDIPGTSRKANKFLYHIASMYHKVQDSWKLMVEYEEETGMTYDVVMHIRPDLRFSFFNLPKILTHLKKNDFIMPLTQNYLGYNDQCGLGKRSTMQILMNLFDDYSAYYQKGVYVGSWAESLIKHRLEEYAIKTYKCPFSTLGYFLHRVPKNGITQSVHAYDIHLLKYDPYWNLVEEDPVKSVEENPVEEAPIKSVEEAPIKSVEEAFVEIEPNSAKPGVFDYITDWWTKFRRKLF